MPALLHFLTLAVVLIAGTSVSSAQLREHVPAQEHTPPDETAPDTTASSARSAPGFYATVDGLGFGSFGNGTKQFGGTLGYRFGNGLELGAGLHRQNAGPGSAYSLGITAGYTHALSARSGIRLGARFTAGSDNLYAIDRWENSYAPGFSFQTGGQQLRLLRADVDATLFHRLDLTRWMSVSPNVGVFATSTRHTNRDQSAYGDYVGSNGLFLGLQTGLDLTFRLSDKVSLTLPLRLRLFPQNLVDDRTSFDFRSPTMGTGIRIDF